MPYKQIKLSVKYIGGRTLKAPPVITDSHSAAYTARTIHDQNTLLWKETAYILCLNSHNTLLGWNCLATGGMDTVCFDIRIIATIALKTISTGIIITHNHPSGCVLPSVQDIQITRRIKSALEIIGINLLDHIILTDQDHFSMKEACLF